MHQTISKVKFSTKYLLLLTQQM